MKVQTILEYKGSRVVTVQPDADVRSAAQLLKVNNIGAVVVVERGAVAGILSERDIVRMLASRGADVLEMKVRDLMTRAVIICTAEDNLTQVMKLMTVHRARHLPVMDGDALIGIVSIGDVVKHRLEELALEADVLRDAYIASH